jgi:thiol:disulfide interchange protein DsbC
MAAYPHRYWLACLLFALTTGAIAAPVATPEETIRARFAAGYPDIKVSSIAPTVWTNVYEVVTPEGIIYSDATGEYAMSGQILATASKENLTQARLGKLTAIEFASLPFSSAIKVVKGNGSRKLAVFADPNCPYCRQLEEELQSVNDVTVYTFLFPLEELHPGAKQNALGIWCSKDPAEAWTQWMIKQVQPAAASCAEDTITALNKLGIKLNIVGTPTLFFSDGRRISGLIPLPQLEQELSKVGPT